MTSVLRILPIGGCGEIGKNMTVIEYGQDIIIIDAGIMFPENDMLGIDFIIPDWQALREKKDRIRALIVTHGHEDHTGAVPYLLKEFNIPVYATRLTCGLLEVKLKQHKILDKVNLNTISAGEELTIGPFKLEFFRVAHSIPDGVGIGITTPAGLLVHTSDYKFDHTPVDGQPTDFAKLAEFGGRGVLALLGDSTNADQPGTTPSERVIDDAFDRAFRAAKGRIIVATFASLISRIQQVANASMRHNRKMAIAGTSMLENTRMARKLGYLNFPGDMLIRLDEANSMPPRNVVIMATGTQGEPSSVLARVSKGIHNRIKIEHGDTVIMSSHPIPGNEEMVHRIINGLYQRGAEVLYDPIDTVHVSGHASQEELKLMINLVKPQYVIPVHGELRHLHAHARLAREVGIEPQNIYVIENGYPIEFDDGEARIGKRVPGGYVYIDGARVGDVGPSVLRERDQLGRDGFVMAIVHRDPDSGELLDTPEIFTRGFVYQKEADEVLADATETVINTVESNPHAHQNTLHDKVKKALSNHFYKETKRRPMILIVISDI